MKNFFKKIKIEEYFLSIVFLVYLFFFWNHLKKLDFKALLSASFHSIRLTSQWWFFPFPLILFLNSFLWLHLLLIKKALPFKFELKIKLEIKSFLYLLKTLSLLVLLFSLFLLLNGQLQLITKNRLANPKIFALEKKVFKTLPFFWLNSITFQKFFEIFGPIFINSFLSLSLGMSLCFLFFYLLEDPYFFKGSLIAIFLSLALAFPIWYFFPVNSPLNFLGENLKNIPNFQPAPEIKKWQEKFWKDQRENPPVSTFPSMHWAWATILVYFLFKKNKISLVFTLPWFFFLGLGSILVGAHYLLDGIFGIFLAFFSIFVSNFLIRFEKRYLIEDKKEIEFKKNLKEFIFFPYQKEIEILKQIFKRP